MNSDQSWVSIFSRLSFDDVRKVQRARRQKRNRNKNERRTANERETSVEDANIENTTAQEPEKLHHANLQPPSHNGHGTPHSLNDDNEESSTGSDRDFDRHLWPLLAALKAQVVSGMEAMQALVDLYKQVSSLSLETAAWKGLVSHANYVANIQWDQYETLDCSRACSEVVAPGESVECVFQAVPPGEYLLAFECSGESDERRYCSVASSSDRWLTTAFRSESRRIWDYTTSCSLHYGEDNWTKYVLFPQRVQVKEDFASVSVKLHRPHRRAYGCSDILPDTARLVPAAIAATEFASPSPSFDWNFLLPVSSFPIFTSKSRAGRARNHFSWSSRTTEGDGDGIIRAVSVYDASNVEFVGIFRGVPAGRYRIAVFMRNHTDDHWSAAWLSGTAVSRGTALSSLLGAEPWALQLDGDGVGGAAWGAPHCWRNCCTAQDSVQDRNESIPSRGLILPPLYLGGAENGLYIDSQRHHQFNWRYFEGPDVSVSTEDVSVTDAEADIFVALRVAFAGRGDGPMTVQHFALRELTGEPSTFSTETETAVQIERQEAESGFHATEGRIEESEAAPSLAENAIVPTEQPRTPELAVFVESEEPSPTCDPPPGSLMSQKRLLTSETGLGVNYPLRWWDLPSRWWDHLMLHLNVRDLGVLAQSCAAMSRKLARPETWVALVRHRLARAALSDPSLRWYQREWVSRLEARIRTAESLEEWSKWQCLLICHPHAARGYRSPSEELRFKFRLPAGHYRLRGTLDCKGNLREAHFRVNTLDQADFGCGVCLLETHTCAYNEELYAGSCQRWSPRDTFSLTSFQEVVVSWALGWDVIFEKLEVLEEAAPVITVPVFFHFQETETEMPQPLLVTPLSFARAARFWGDVHERFVVSPRPPEGSAFYIPHDRMVSLRAVLPKVPSGVYTVFFSLYCHHDVSHNPEYGWRESLFWTCIQLEAALVPAPRVSVLTRDIRQADDKEDDMVGVSLLEDNVSYPELYSEELPVKAVSKVCQTVTRADFPRAGWHVLSLQRPLVVPTSSDSFHVHLNIRLVPEGAILLDCCGLRPLEVPAGV
eukprot:Gregarina_sp_Poly_1__2545@NODE_168_length_12074_cov_98_169901_g149_i0_p1_GENE_NODE_168_length_12074_cov_98_169901_g149_i0NODE_168_length_12074_cov_98_169901_g149_i0_p1_ORF_typecomplete_len1056_score175_69DUF2141/PF09912_9/9DUF2141/PF09912_9/17DUF2141/PF09912_9/4_4e03DUF2141/PF09912_9/3_1e03_NODE_168_length_12074_cov_98_169901_g149_i015694736